MPDAILSTTDGNQRAAMALTGNACASKSREGWYLIIRCRLLALHSGYGDLGRNGAWARLGSVTLGRARAACVAEELYSKVTVG